MDLNLYQIALLGMKPINPHNKSLGKYCYYSQHTESLSNRHKVTQLTGKVAWIGDHVEPMKAWAPNPHMIIPQGRASQNCPLKPWSCFPPCSSYLPPSALLKYLSSFKPYLRLTFCLKAFLKTLPTFELSPVYTLWHIYTVYTKPLNSCFI